MTSLDTRSSEERQTLTQSLSKMMTVSAAVRLMPRPPALVLSRKTNTSGSLENFLIYRRRRARSGSASATSESSGCMHEANEVVSGQPVPCLPVPDTHVLLPVSVGHAAIQSAVLEASQVAVIHQEVQDGRHLAEDENLEHRGRTFRDGRGHG